MSDSTESIIIIGADWCAIAAFTRIIAPLINVHTGVIGQPGTEEAFLYLSIPAEGSPYQNERIRMGAMTVGTTGRRGAVPQSTLGAVTITKYNENSADIIIEPNEEYISFWATLSEKIQAFASEYRRVQRESTSSQFENILDRYYEAKEQGHKVKLAELAREAGVNYDSLRQAKIRYDRKLREPEPLG